MCAIRQLLVNHLEPLTEQQMVGLCNLQESSQQAEDALSQGKEALQQSLAETLASGSLGPTGSSGDVANYMGQMAMAMGKLGTLESFIRQVPIPMTFQVLGRGGGQHRNILFSGINVLKLAPELM